MSELFRDLKQVQAFSPTHDDDEYEYEEETLYVTLDVGPVDPTLFPNASSYRLIGLETPTPFLQVSNTIFKGSYEELIGTELLFVDGRDETDKARRFVTPLGSTEHRIRFREVELIPKTRGETSGATPSIDHARGSGRPVRGKKIGARSGIEAATGTSTRGMGAGRGSGKGFGQRRRKQAVDDEEQAKRKKKGKAKAIATPDDEEMRSDEDREMASLEENDLVLMQLDFFDNDGNVGLGEGPSSR